MILDQAWAPAQFAMPLGLEGCAVGSCDRCGRWMPVAYSELIQNTSRGHRRRTRGAGLGGARRQAGRGRGVVTGLDRLLVDHRGRARSRLRGFAHHRLAPRRIVERGLDRPRPRLRRLHRAAPRRRRRRHLRDRVPAEKSLSVDNLFVFILYSRSPAFRRPAAARAVLGHCGRARDARGADRGGVQVLQHFHWAIYPLAGSSPMPRGACCADEERQPT